MGIIQELASATLQAGGFNCVIDLFFERTRKFVNYLYRPVKDQLFDLDSVSQLAITNFRVFLFSFFVSFSPRPWLLPLLCRELLRRPSHR